MILFFFFILNTVNTFRPQRYKINRRIRQNRQENSIAEVKKSKKLLCSQVKIGNQVKQIVSGIKAYYKPGDMVGKKVMVLVNLKPARRAGVLSEGMLLCAEDEKGNLALMTAEKEMPSGAEIC